jgi:hypothetical protein
MIQNILIIRKSNPVISFDGSLFDGDPCFWPKWSISFSRLIYPDLLSDIDGAVLRQDADALRGAAHTMKARWLTSAPRPLSSRRAPSRRSARAADLAAAREATLVLRTLMDRFAPQLEAAAAGAEEPDPRPPAHPL